MTATRQPLNSNDFAAYISGVYRRQYARAFMSAAASMRMSTLGILRCVQDAPQADLK